MSYTLTVNTGALTRDSDGRQIAPCQSADEPELVEYNVWVAAGNEPTEAFATEV